MLDVRGLSIHLDDKVGVAVRTGNVAEIKTGTVVWMDEDQGKITVLWDEPQWGKTQTTIAVNGQVVARGRVVVL